MVGGFMKDNKLIVIEGACDGIGKTTQFELLKEHLEKDGVELVTHHFPTYETHQGALAQNYLKGDYGKPNKLSPYFINSLYAVDRAVTWNTKLQKEFLNGKTILLDRYTTSSLIYQTVSFEDLEEKKKFIDFVTDYEYEKLGIKKPDKVIFLYMPFELALKIRMERKQNDGVENDIHESDLEFMKKVYDNAMFVADYLNWDKVKCNDGDNLMSIEEIHNSVYTLVKKR